LSGFSCSFELKPKKKERATSSIQNNDYSSLRRINREN
jgi:hypothetical protein